jgi:hypothetical protein
MALLQETISAALLQLSATAQHMVCLATFGSSWLTSSIKPAWLINTFKGFDPLLLCCKVDAPDAVQRTNTGAAAADATSTCSNKQGGQCSSPPTEQHNHQQQQQQQQQLLLVAVVVSEQDGVSLQLQATVNNVSCWADAVLLISRTSTDGASLTQGPTASATLQYSFKADGAAKKPVFFTTSQHGLRFPGSVATARNAALAFADQQGMQWALLLHEGESVDSTYSKGHIADALKQTKANVLHCFHPTEAPVTEVCHHKQGC